MSSPTSTSSSQSQLDDVLQSTKDRRRERNRLAAQKHRLRRSQRMSQLEQQVQALQQEKHSLLSHIDASEDPDWHPDALVRKRPRTSPAPRVSLVAVESADGDEKDYLARLEDRIIELERWTEDLSGSLADSRDSEARLKTELQTRAAHAEAQERRFSETIQAYAAERGELQNAIQRLEKTAELSGRSSARAASRPLSVGSLEDELRAQKATVKDLLVENARLKESLEGCEVTLELQRRANETLRERLQLLALSAEAKDRHQGQSNHSGAVEEVRQLKERLEVQRAEWEPKLQELEQENQRLVETLNSEFRSNRQLSTVKSRLNKTEAENNRLKEMMESYETKVESLEESARTCQIDLESENHRLRIQLQAMEGKKNLDPESPPEWEGKMLTAEREINQLQSRLQKQDARANTQERHLKEKADASERERQRLSEQVSGLLDAWEKVRTFLASKGIPMDLE